MRTISKAASKAGMKDDTPLILMLGHDATLLETRQWVLQSRGYSVLSIDSLSAFESIPRTRPVSLLLLCYTLSPVEREGAIAIASSRWPHAVHLALEADQGRAPTGILGQLLHTQNGPARLISMVGSLLENRRPEREARAS